MENPILDVGTQGTTRHSIRGNVVGGLLVILGAILGGIVGQVLYTNYEADVLRRELAWLISDRAQARLIRAENVLFSSKSSVFDERWTDYINHGYMPWNEKLPVMSYSMNRFSRADRELLDEVGKEFGALHSVLQQLRRSQNATDATQLQKAETDAREAIKEIRGKVTTLINTVMDDAY